MLRDLTVMVCRFDVVLCLLLLASLLLASVRFETKADAPAIGTETCLDAGFEAGIDDGCLAVGFVFLAANPVGRS